MKLATSAYLAGEAAAFFEGHPRDPAARARAVARACRPLAPSVMAALVAQNAKLAPSSARDAHLAALAGGATAVVTGQQVGLFGGPLFSLYKAASAIRVARALAAETGTPVVPVFWLQTEDHDLPEIASCGTPAATVAVLASADDRQSIAHCLLPAEVTACLDQLTAALAGLPHADAHLARLARHYRPGVPWATAFAGMLADLLGELVFIDPRDPALADAARPVHHRALVEAPAISAALLARGAALAAAGFDAPVHVRDGAPLSFYHPEGAAGPRRRVDACTPELLDALAKDPLAFSTSALLRPILQDSLLPTAAYVGGPGEIAYFAQLQPVYEHFGVPMPLIVHRARFRIVEPAIRRLLDRLGLTPADATQPAGSLLVASGGIAEDVTARLLAPFHAAHDAVSPSVTALGPHLAKALAKTRASVERSVGRLAAKIRRELGLRDAARVDGVARVQRALQPGGAPQERVFGVPYFAARLGERELVSVLGAIDPYDPTLKDLEP